MLAAFAKRKYNSDEKAMDLFKRIAANQVEFHRGHSDLVELLVGGQSAVCFTCYSHHFPPRIKKGAPIQALLAEGVGEIGGAVSVLKGAPHPRLLCFGCVGPSAKKASECGRRPGKRRLTPNVEPLGEIPPHRDLYAHHRRHQEFPKYQKLWKEIFQIR